MQQRCTVCSPFIQNKIQLFYEASLSRETGSIIVRVFNHRAVLRNKKMIELGKGVYQIFTAEEYLIGLDESHSRVWIVDVRRAMNNIARGVIRQRNGLSEQLKSKRLKFSKFIFDKPSNLVYAIYGGHYVFYFRINHFEDSSLINQHLQQQTAEQNKSISINIILQSQQSIDKLQIKHQKVKRDNIIGKMQKNNIQKQINKCLEPQQEVQGIYDQQKTNNHNGQDNDNNVICLLIREKCIMRLIEMDWNRDLVKKIKEEPNVHDFCFKNGWDLVIKQEKNAKQQMMRRQQRSYRVIQQQGRFDQKVTLSADYSIFTSKQNLFIIDPTQQTIAGVYHKEWYLVTDCHSIPKSINSYNTLLMVDKPDEFYLRFMFQVFEIKQGEFNNKRVITPLVEITQGAQLQLFLKRNLQKIYTPNAFIHPYFRDKVSKCVRSIIQREQEKQLQKSQQMVRNERQRNESDNNEDDMKQENISELSKMFLQRFIMCEKQSDNLLDRLMFSLINSGITALFGDRDRVSQQRNNRTKRHSVTYEVVNKKKSISSSQILDNISIKHRPSLQFNYKQDKENNNIQHDNPPPRCSFNRWNLYFQEIINDQYQVLTQLFEQSNNGANSNKSDSEYSSSVGNRFNKLYDNIAESKRKLSLVSNSYSRILNFIISEAIGSQSHSSLLFTTQSQLSNSVRYYKERIKMNISKAHSIYLLFDMFDLGRRGDESKTLFEVIQRAVIKVFRHIQERKKQIIQWYKKDQKSQNRESHNKPFLISAYGNNRMTINPTISQPPLLMLHEHFTHSQALAIPSQDITVQLFLQYLLLNINQFEEIAYFYHLVKRQLINNQNQQQMKADDVMEERMGCGEVENHAHDQDDQDRSYPYVNRNVINFFHLIESVPVIVMNNKLSSQFSTEEIEEFRDRIQKATKLAMLINCTSFINYMIQLSSLYFLPRTLINIVNSLSVQPFSQHISSLSEVFIYRQRLIMNSLLHCAFNLNNGPHYTIGLREMLIYQMKRIIKVSDKVKSVMNENIINSNSLRKTLINEKYSPILQQPQPTQSQVHSIKNTLLEQFIAIILGRSYSQGIRWLEQLKNQCLAQEQDKQRFRSIVNKITSS